jgi:hypothetical protein
VGVGREVLGSLSLTKISAVVRKTSENITFIDRSGSPDPMATAKTGSFYLTETVQLPAANPNGAAGRQTGTIDLSAYVNVPTGQAIAIDQVDFIWQRDSDYGNDISNYLASEPGSLTMQVTDLNPGNAFVRADDQSLVASGALSISDNSGATFASDIYPDNFGPSGLSDMFIVVNDQLYLTAGNDVANVGSGVLYCTARIRCRVVKLSTKDWMAVAIQSTAADN